MTTKDVNLTKLVEPRFLTLTGSPANQTAFKIVRKDGDTMNMQHVQRRRIRRSDSLVSITFEAGLDEAGASALLAEWGVEDFTMEASGDRLKAILRTDATDTMEVAIPDGRTITVLKPISNATPDAPAGVSVVRMDFVRDAFPDTSDVTEWLKRNDIDETKVKISLTDETISVHRSDAAAQETRTVQIDTGISFTIARSETVDIPANFVTVVSDTAYGSWGWGQLDFSAYMADREFSEASDEAIYALRNVLDRIMFYSDVPITVRKDLVRSAVNQYADYAISLMDALPSKMVVAIRSSFSKESEVSKASPGAQTATRQDDATQSGAAQPGAAVATAPAPAGAPQPAGEAVLTRADVQAMVTDATKGLSDQIAALTAAIQTQRSEPTTTEPAAEGEKEPTLADVVRSTAAMADTMNKLASAVTALESGTVVRSDSGDPKTTQEKRDVFRGVFGARRSQSAE